MQRSLSLILPLRKTSECRNYNPWGRRRGKRMGRGEKILFSLPAPWVAGQTTNEPWLILMIEQLYYNVKFLYFCYAVMWHSKHRGFTLSARFNISLRSKKTKMVSEKRKRDSQWSVSTKSNCDVIIYYSLQVTWYPCDMMAWHNSQSNQGDERGLGRGKRPNLWCLSTFTREQTFHVLYTCWLIRLYSGELTQPRVHDDDDGSDRFYEHNYVGA